MNRKTLGYLVCLVLLAFVPMLGIYPIFIMKICLLYTSDAADE